MTEAAIMVNGRLLTPAQSMTVRVALSSFVMEMREPNALGSDEHGTEMARLYADRALEVLQGMAMR